MLRAASGGIVISLALVHIFPGAIHQGETLAEKAELNPEFNIGGCCTLFGIFLMMVLEGGALRLPLCPAAAAAAAQRQPSGGPFGSAACVS